MGKYHDFKSRCLFVTILAVLFVSGGCLARTYTVIRERPDLEITGNQGYLLGRPAEKKESQIKMRKTYVLEVEFGKPVSVEKKDLNSEENIAEESNVYENLETEIIKPEKNKVEKVNTYVVKKGDTLEKIAARPEIYGNKKKWYKIFKANESQLKSQDKIFPGQVLRIPE